MDIFHKMHVCVSFYTFMTMIFFFFSSPEYRGKDLKKKKVFWKLLKNSFKKKSLSKSSALLRESNGQALVMPGN